MNKLTILHQILWGIFLFKIRVPNSFGRTPAAADNYISVCFRRVGSQKQDYGQLKKKKRSRLYIHVKKPACFS